MRLIRFVLLPSLVTIFLFSSVIGMNNSERIRDASDEPIDINKIISVTKGTSAQQGLRTSFLQTVYYTAELPDNVQLVAQLADNKKFCTKRTINENGVILSVPIDSKYFDGIKLYYDLSLEEK
ncbi:hypothetical protein HYX58_02760 [Candidatus Dependentiae bacterium]|nr:hypothetical protein [Candidatus Dependentiae bacterium]